MSTLTLHFRESFDNDTVVVRLGGDERYRAEGLKTKLLLGYAEIVELDIQQHSVLLEVDVPSRGTTAQYQLDLRHDLDVEVWLTGQGLQLRIPPEPPAYL